MYNRIDELTKEVERFIRTKGENKNGVYQVEKDLFLESLFDTSYKVLNDGTLEFDYNFLNPRINKKFLSVYKDLKEITTKEDLFADISLIILEFFEEEKYININYDNYHNQSDDISKIVFLIDKQVRRESLQKGGYTYSRKQEDAESRKYFAMFGENLMWMNELHEDTEIEKMQTIGEDDVISQVSNTDENWDKVQKIIDTVGLTKRQEEVLEVLMYCDFNRTHAAEVLEVKPHTISETFSRIKERFADHYNTFFKPEKKTFDDCINDNLSTEEYFKLIKEYMDEDNTVCDTVYSIDKELRVLFIRDYKKVEDMNLRDKVTFVEEFKNIYKKY